MAAQPGAVFVIALPLNGALTAGHAIGVANLLIG
jgi:hypothetical protein